MSSRSKDLFELACRYMPGGVNSPVRAFGAVGGEPVFFERGEGAYLYDVDGREYVDYVGAWGPLILGHGAEEVLRGLEEGVGRLVAVGAPVEAEVELARLVVELVPSVEMVRFVNSGTEATMAALRLARAYTGREKFIKFAGCYHGSADSFLVQAGSGATTFGVASSRGVPEGVVGDTLVAEFNDLESVKGLYREYRGEIAAVILEPVAGNMGLVLAEEDFLRSLREVTWEEGSLLIFDEVMSGFRVGLGGAQEMYGVMPDLTVLGKVIGGGLPVGAYGGRREIMEWVSPLGPVYQAGTLSGNPLAMRVGCEVLKRVSSEGFYEDLFARARELEEGILENLKELGRGYRLVRVGSMFCLFFRGGEVRNYSQALGSDTGLYGRYFHGMLEEGIYLPPSQFECFFISSAHGELEIEKMVRANYRVLCELESLL